MNSSANSKNNYNNNNNNNNNNIGSSSSSSSNNSGANSNPALGLNPNTSIPNKSFIPNNNLNSSAYIGGRMNDNSPLLPATNTWLQQQPPPFPSSSSSSQSIPSSTAHPSAGMGRGMGSGVSSHPSMEDKNSAALRLGSTPNPAPYTILGNSPSSRPHGTCHDVIFSPFHPVNDSNYLYIHKLFRPLSFLLVISPYLSSSFLAISPDLSSSFLTISP